jgi:hypothetical protein
MHIIIMNYLHNNNYYKYLDDIFMNDLINNNNKFIDNITRIINNYKKMNYKFMSREKIFIIQFQKLLQKIFSVFQKLL